MADISFMQKKYSVDSLVTHYLDDIKKLKVPGQPPIEESKLQQYFHAAHAFKNVSVKDIVQFALSYGRHVSGKGAQMKDALPTLLGNRVVHPTKVDVAYAQLLLTYTKAFKAYRVNIKEWTLRFLLSSRFSPFTAFLDREIDRVIAQTQQRIASFSSS